MNIPYGKQNITASDIDAVVKALKDPYLTQGPKIKEFEEAFATYVEAKYAVAVSNGTAALHLCAMALNVDENTRVITTPITFSASANCVRYCGGQVEFADIDPATALIDIDSVKMMLENAPAHYYSGIIPVDFMGYPVRLDKLKAIAAQYNLWIIEDACHAPGGGFIANAGNVQKCGKGNYAELAIFSFHPVKHIACGEGGMITTNDEGLYHRLMTLRTHGITKDPNQMIENHGGWYMELQELGHNYRLTDFQSALGLSQLAKADKGLSIRKAIAKRYDDAFKDDAKVQIIIPDQDASHAYHLYVIQVENRKGLYDYLRTKGIYAQVHYIPVHMMPYYRNISKEKIVLQNAERYYERCLSIPMYPTLTGEEQDYVIKMIKAFYV